MNEIKMKYFTKVNYRHVWNEKQERIKGQVKHYKGQMNCQQNFLSIYVSTETLEMTSDALTNAGKKVKSNIACELSHRHIKLMISSSDEAK